MALTTMSKWLLFLVLFWQIYQNTRYIDYTKSIVSTQELVGRSSVLNVFKKAEFSKRHTTLVVSQAWPDPRRDGGLLPLIKFRMMDYYLSLS